MVGRRSDSRGLRIKAAVLLVLPAALAFYFAPACPVAAQATEGPVPEVSWLFVGDTSFGENYQDVLAARGEENVLEVHGYDYLIEPFADILRDASFVVANLETPITDLRISPLRGRKLFIHYADIAETPRMLRAYGFGLVSLGNNHAFDYWIPGLRQTIGLLDERNIASCGAGATEAAARRAHVQEVSVGGDILRIAVLCAYEYVARDARSYAFYAEGDKGGVNRLAAERIAQTIAGLRRAHENLFVVVFPHWGDNYRSATAEQREMGQAIIDAGADLVIGHGAHTLQEIEFYKGRWIVYSLGNFVFASPGRYERLQAPPYSLIASLRLNGANGSVSKVLRLYPIFSDNLVSHYRSRFVTGEEFEEIRSMLAEHSPIPQGFDTAVAAGEDRYGHYLEVSLD